jgi:radical SAM protein with 4Fe4S-binding SPASM domain
MELSILINSLKLLRNKQIKKIPKKTLFDLFNILKNEKIIKFENKILISIQVPPYPSKAFDRFLEAGIKAKEGSNTPVIVNLAVTHQCRYHCWHCSASPKKGKDLPLNTIVETIQKFQEKGTCIFSITGGEPLLREDLVEIIAHIDDRSSVFVFTTGDGLTEEKAKELKDAGLLGVMISLDHYKPEIHDDLRGYKGAYDIVIKGVKNAQKAHLYVGLSCVITKDIIKNNEIWKMLEIAKNLSVQEIMMLEPTPVGELFNTNTCVLSIDERKQLIEFHKQINKNRKYKKYPKVSVFPYFESKELIGCTAGYNMIYIDADGNIRPCDFTPLIFGNIQEEPIENLWQKMNCMFNKPRDFCFMLENHKLMRQIGNGEYPLPYEKSLEVCKKCPSSEIPLFYKKLGIK